MTLLDEYVLFCYLLQVLVVSETAVVGALVMRSETSAELGNLWLPSWAIIHALPTALNLWQRGRGRAGRPARFGRGWAQIAQALEHLHVWQRQIAGQLAAEFEPERRGRQRRRRLAQPEARALAHE